MRRAAAVELPGSGDPLSRLRGLFTALTVGPLAVTDDSTRTPTAAEAFATRRADCVGFALLFAALAREGGLEPGFAVSSTVEPEAGRTRLLVQRGHLVATFGGRVFDLGGEQPLDPVRHQVVSERTALALFHSNRGAQDLAGGRATAAIERFYDAVRLDPSVAWVWTNLGVALRRAGDAAGAVLAHEMALRLDPSDLAARRNLAAARSAAARKR
jgi:tetratricopeptide (TPR) repeat protein